MRKFIFACMASSGPSARQSLILARSIRSFAGVFSDQSVWVLVPNEENNVPADLREKLLALNVRLVPFEIDQAALAFPFADKVFASAAAEFWAADRSDFLAWMDSGSLVIRPPKGLLLDEGKNLGCRPVDHVLIGSRYDEPISPFWKSIYRKCRVPESSVFPMVSTVDAIRIRPYFNAGLLVVRPEKGLLQAWRDSFQGLYLDDHFEAFYRQDVLYRIFVHQAVLAGVILAEMGQHEMQEFPYLINYPLHMHADYPADRRPQSMDELATCRYEAVFEDPDWEQGIPAQEPLRSWLIEQLEAKS